MIPFEALLPYGVIIIMFGVAGTGMSAAKLLREGGNKPRVHRDAWDKMMMERDMRLTKEYRKQSDEPIAPEYFKTSSVWRASRIWDD
ncbi:hypothetical protein V1505DRAFT_366404 [Lipomyces doorenjongii]